MLFGSLTGFRLTYITANFNFGKLPAFIHGGSGYILGLSSKVNLLICQIKTPPNYFPTKR